MKGCLDLWLLMTLLCGTEPFLVHCIILVPIALMYKYTNRNLEVVGEQKVTICH